MITLPQTDLNAFGYTGLNVKKLLYLGLAVLVGNFCALWACVCDKAEMVAGLALLQIY